jgi:hypothetical protein
MRYLHKASSHEVRCCTHDPYVLVLADCGFQPKPLHAAYFTAGLLSCLVAASKATAKLLQHPLKLQRQQQQQQDNSDKQGAQQALPHSERVIHSIVLDLAIGQINLFTSLAAVWPTSSSSSRLCSSEELGSAALPVLNLALLLLDASSGRVGYVVGVMDPVMYVCSSLLPDLRGTAASAAAGEAAVSSRSSISSSSCSSSGGGVPLSPGVQQLLQSEQLPKLLAATQALHVLGLSSTTRVRGQPGDDRHDSTSGMPLRSGAPHSQRLSISSSSVSSSDGMQQGAEQLLAANISTWHAREFTQAIEDLGGLHLRSQQEHDEGALLLRC